MMQDYAINVIENGPWSKAAHILMIGSAAAAFVFAFRRGSRRVVICLGLLPFVFGVAATSVHAFNKYMVWGEHMFGEFRNQVAWDVSSPLGLSLLLTLLSVAGGLLLRRGRPPMVPKLPQQPAPMFLYRAADGTVCGPHTESKLRALQRMGVVTADTAIAPAASPEDWTTLGALPNAK